MAGTARSVVGIGPLSIDSIRSRGDRTAGKPILAKWTVSLLTLLAAALPASAQTSFPMITHCTPTAVQRGKTAEVTVEGQMNFAAAYKVLTAVPGLVGEVVPPGPKAKADPKAAVRSIKVKFTVGETAPLGPQEFRVATELGLSSLGQLVVTNDPVVSETPAAKDREKAATVPVPSVVCGRIEAAENVDFYRVKAAAGRVLTLEVFCARIQDKIHDLQKHADPLVRVFDADGRELAAGDDDFFADPVLAFPVPKDGEYLIEVRDSKYDGDPRWTYALAVTDRPYAAHTFPFAANPGQSVTLEAVGAGTPLAVTAPTRPGLQTVTAKVNGVETNAFPLIVTPLPLVTEAEPNDDPKRATTLAFPGGANGRIGRRRDLDFFRFAAKKGDAMRLEVFARRFGTDLRSRADISMDLMTKDGKPIASVDDTVGKDPRMLFTAPTDGEYLLRVRELNNKGGPGFVYHLEAAPAKPDFAIRCDPSKAMIGAGSRTAWYVLVERLHGFTGPVKVEVRNLPKGVTAGPLTIPAAMTQGCLVLAADPGAKVDASVVEVVGTAEIGGAAVSHAATPVEEIYFPGGGRGRFDVGMQAVAVTGPSDVREVKVSTNKVVLKPGQEVTIDVSVTRSKDYDKTLTLDVMLRHLGGVFGNPLPPGVTLVEGKSKTLLGTGSVGSIVLKAAPDAAECADVPIAVQAYVPVNFVVKIGYASEPILVSVKK